MLSACCSTAWPTISSTFSGCNSLRRCAPHKSKLCAFSCSRSARASAKQLVVFAFTWPAAGPFKISSSPSGPPTPLSLSRLSTTHSRAGGERSYLKNGSRAPKGHSASLSVGQQRGRDPSLRQPRTFSAIILASDELSRLGLDERQRPMYPVGLLRRRPKASSVVLVLLSGPDF